MPKLPTLSWLGIAAAGATVIGAFGPWAKVIGLVNTSIGGTDGSNDGWLVVGAAVGGAAAIFFWGQTHNKLLALVALGAGVGGVAVSFHDRQNVQNIQNSNTTDLAVFQVGWGLNVALGASAVLAIVGLVALVGHPDSPGMKAEMPPQPPGSESDSEDT